MNRTSKNSGLSQYREDSIKSPGVIRGWELIYVRKQLDVGGEFEGGSIKGRGIIESSKQWWFLKILTRGALGTYTPISWVLPSYNHAHVFKDGNMTIYFNIDIV